MLTALTSNWSEIRLPIIRAYLGCNRSSSNQFASTLFALRSSSDRHRKTKKSYNCGTSSKSSVFIDSTHKRGSITKYFSHYPSLSRVQGYLLETVKDIVVPFPAIQTCHHLSKTTSFSTTHFLFASRPSFITRKIGGRSIYE